MTLNEVKIKMGGLQNAKNAHFLTFCSEKIMKYGSGALFWQPFLKLIKLLSIAVRCNCDI